MIHIEAPISLIDLLLVCELSITKGLSRRLILQNAVSINGETITDIDYVIEDAAPLTLKVGKHQFNVIFDEA